MDTHQCCMGTLWCGMAHQHIIVLHGHFMMLHGHALALHFFAHMSWLRAIAPGAPFDEEREGMHTAARPVRTWIGAR